jgi:hypothetical protein
MKKPAVVNAAAATAAWVAASGLALASEGGPEGLGDMSGAKPLFLLLGGVVGLGVVIWLMIKFMGRKG